MRRAEISGEYKKEAPRAGRFVCLWLVRKVHELRFHSVERVELFLELLRGLRVAAELEDEQPRGRAGPGHGLVVEAEPREYRASVFGQNALHFDGALAAIQNSYRHYLVTVHINTPRFFFIMITNFLSEILAYLPPPLKLRRRFRYCGQSRHVIKYSGVPRRSGGMADAADSKSAARKGVGVRVPSPAPVIATVQSFSALNRFLLSSIWGSIGEVLDANLA